MFRLSSSAKMQLWKPQTQGKRKREREREDSREHFEIRIHKRILEIHYNSEVPIFDLLSEADLPPGVFYRICLS